MLSELSNLWQSFGKEQKDVTNFQFTLSDPQGPRQISGWKEVVTVRESDSDPPYSIPFNRTSICLQIGGPEYPAVFSADYGSSDFGPGSPATITLTAVDDKGQLIEVNYHPYEVEIGKEGPLEARVSKMSFRKVSSLGIILGQDELEMLNYYDFSSLPDQLLCGPTRLEFENQINRRDSFRNPQLISI